MKQLLIFLFLGLGLTSYSQNPIKFRLSATVDANAIDTVKYNTNGTLLHKGDQFVMYISAAGNSNTSTRQLLVDLQYDNSALTLVSMNNTGTGGNGGILPQGSNTQESYYQYPGYSFNQTTNNTLSNGTTDCQYASYNYTSGGTSTIVRYTLTWSGTQGMPYSGYWGLVKIVFNVNKTMVGYSMNPVQLNFIAGWNGSGVYTVTYNVTPGAKYSAQIVPFGSTNVVFNQGFTATSTSVIKTYDLSSLKKMNYDLIFIDVTI